MGKDGMEKQVAGSHDDFKSKLSLVSRNCSITDLRWRSGLLPVLWKTLNKPLFTPQFSLWLLFLLTKVVQYNFFSLRRFFFLLKTYAILILNCKRYNSGQNIFLSSLPFIRIKSFLFVLYILKHLDALMGLRPHSFSFILEEVKKKKVSENHNDSIMKTLGLSVLILLNYKIEVQAMSFIIFGQNEQNPFFFDFFCDNYFRLLTWLWDYATNL